MCHGKFNQKKRNTFTNRVLFTNMTWQVDRVSGVHHCYSMTQLLNVLAATATQ